MRAQVREQVEQLMMVWKPVDTTTLPKKLPTESIKMMLDLFQPREFADDATGVTNKSHMKVLAKTITAKKDLDPIKVLHVDGLNIVIDGHHRLEAYKRANKAMVPVAYFTGSPKDALIEAGQENNKDRLGTSTREKTQRAWTLTTAGLEFSKDQVARGANVSDGTVGQMRRVAKWYEDQGREPPDSWGAAQRQFANKEINDDDDQVFDYEAKLQEKANKVSTALRQRFRRIDNEEEAIVFARGLLGFIPSHYLSSAITTLITNDDNAEYILETARETIEAKNASESLMEDLDF